MENITYIGWDFGGATPGRTIFQKGRIFVERLIDTAAREIGIEPITQRPEIDLRSLYDGNLISGVVSGSTDTSWCPDPMRASVVDPHHAGSPRTMDPVFLTIAELGRLYDQRELSPVEVTRSLLDRIAAHDAKLHSFIRVTPEAALAEAQAAERELMAGRRRGPLHGIPYALKDIVETAGSPTTGHSKLCKDYVPAADAHLVTLLKAGGAVLMGKLATWEFALGGPSWDLPWPPARNPWNPDYLPGGSSSGASAAVAAGFVPGAVGTDTGGSIRGPAAVCGIAGLKPTYGRVSRRGVFPNTFTMDHCGPLTRSAGDIALFLQVIAGFDAEDPGSEDVPVPDYRAALTGRIEGLRFGLIEHWYAQGAHPDLVPAISAAVEVLRGLGAVVEPAQLSSLRDYTDCKTTISIAELYAIHEKDLKTRPQDFGRILRNRVLPGAL